MDICIVWFRNENWNQIIRRQLPAIFWHWLHSNNQIRAQPSDSSLLGLSSVVHVLHCKTRGTDSIRTEQFQHKKTPAGCCEDLRLPAASSRQNSTVTLRAKRALISEPHWPFSWDSNYQERGGTNQSDLRALNGGFLFECKAGRFASNFSLRPSQAYDFWERKLPQQLPNSSLKSPLVNRRRKLNTNFLFLELFGHRRDIPARSRDIPPKKFDVPGFEGHTKLFGPHPFTWKTPTPPENIWTKKFGFGFLLLPWVKPLLSWTGSVFPLLKLVRWPQMGGQIRRGWIWRFWVAPIFRPEVPKPLENRYLGTSGLKIGAPQKRQIQPRRIWPPICQKNPRVRKIFVRNSGAGNGCVNFMDAWKNALFLQEKPMSIKFLVLGGGGILGFGGGECRFYFYGRADFSEFAASWKEQEGKATGGYEASRRTCTSARPSSKAFWGRHVSPD